MLALLATSENKMDKTASRASISVEGNASEKPKTQRKEEKMRRLIKVRCSEGKHNHYTRETIAAIENIFGQNARSCVYLVEGVDG